MNCLDDESAILSVNGRHYSYWEDSDGDGFNDLIDPFSSDASQWSDIDGDGYGDNLAPANQPDQCHSKLERHGATAKQVAPMQIMTDLPIRMTNSHKIPPMVDSDGDLLGDNWGNPQWNTTRLSHWPGEFVTNATNSDPSPYDFDNDGFEDPTLIPLWLAYYQDDCRLYMDSQTFQVC